MPAFSLFFLPYWVVFINVTIRSHPMAMINGQNALVQRFRFGTLPFSDTAGVTVISNGENVRVD